MRLIDAEALIKYMCDHCGVTCNLEDECCSTVDAIPVVQGKWVRLDAHKGIEQYKCSVCRSSCYVSTCMNEPIYSYCPNCGARMDGGVNDGKE